MAYLLPVDGGNVSFASHPTSEILQCEDSHWNLVAILYIG
jgi:hypothetical protein